MTAGVLFGFLMGVSGVNFVLASLPAEEVSFSQFIQRAKEPQLVFHNDRALDWRIKLLGHAPSGSIARIQTFLWDNGITTRRLAAHMCLAATRGVDVRFFPDSKSGSIPGKPNVFDKPTNEEVFQYLANCGVQVHIYNHIKFFSLVPFNLPGKLNFLRAVPQNIAAAFESTEDAMDSSLNRLNHRKLFSVVSSKSKEGCMFLGGRNLGNHYQQWEHGEEVSSNSFIDGDVFICNHHLDVTKGDEDVLGLSAAEFDIRWNETGIIYTVQANPQFRYSHIWLEPATAETQKEDAPVHKRSESELVGFLLADDHPHSSQSEDAENAQGVDDEEMGNIPVPYKVQESTHADANFGSISLPLATHWRYRKSGWRSQGDEDEVRRDFNQAISQEQSEIYIETGYGQFDKELKELVESALERGVTVNFVTNSIFTYDGPSSAIAPLMNPWLKEMLQKYSGNHSGHSFVKDFGTRKGTEGGGLFNFWATSVFAGHMVHFKGAGFKCQSKGGKNFKTFLMGSHNFHPRSGVSDKEHALFWDEPAGKECLDAKTVGASAFTQAQISEIHSRYSANGKSKPDYRDLIDKRYEWFLAIDRIFGKKNNQPLLVSYESLEKEIAEAMKDQNAQDTKGKVSKPGYLLAKGLSRYVYSEADAEDDNAQSDLKKDTGRAARKPIKFLINLFGPATEKTGIWDTIANFY